MLVRFLAEAGTEMIPIGGDVGREVIDTFEKFDKDHHAAACILGDCSAYACARRLDAALLCKGEDFLRMDAILA